MLQQNDDKHEQAHARLRSDIRAMEARLELIERQGASMAAQFNAMASTPPDVTKLQFPLPLVATIVCGFLVLGAGMWQIENKLDKAQEHYELQKKDIDDLRKEFRLLQSNVTDFMIQQGRTTR